MVILTFLFVVMGCYWDLEVVSKGGESCAYAYSWGPKGCL
jgi:hypothetical protein